MDPVALVNRLGGVVPVSSLRAARVPRRRLTELVAAGALGRPRTGWYATLPPQHPRFRAARIGGRLTGASALFDMGAWMLHPPRLHVAVPRGSARLRPDPDARIHWVTGAIATDHLRVGLLEALIRVTLDEGLEVSVPCIDWALRTGRLGIVDFERFIQALPSGARCVREWVDDRSQSVLESVARVRLLRRGWPVRSQVPVGELGSIDLVIADHVALELDGREFHESSFERDRRKDLQIAREGRHSIRASYSMVVRSWPDIEAAILAALRARGVLVQDSVVPRREPRGSRPVGRIPIAGD